MRATHSSLPLLFLLLIISYEVGAKEEQPLLKSGYTIAYSSDKSGEFEIYLSGSDGKSKARITSPPESGGGYLAWSPNGKALAFYKKYDERKTWSIHTISNDGSDWKRLTHSKGVWDHSPTWSPDGKKIAFGRTYKNSDGIVQNEIWLMSAQGNEQAKIKGLSGGGPYFTPDGRIVYHSQFKSKKSEISIANADGSKLLTLQILKRKSGNLRSRRMERKLLLLPKETELSKYT